MTKFKLAIIALIMMCAQNIIAQTQAVSGVVTDNNGVPLPGVSVIVQGTAKGVSTNFDGLYTVENVSSTDNLIFSYVGMTAQTIKIGNKSVIDVMLQASAESLDEVVIVGYGSVKKSDLTGSIATIKGDALKDQPFTGLDQALQGKVSGVTVMQNSGAPGGGVLYVCVGLHL